MKKIILYSIVSVFALASCQKNMTNLNIDTKHPSTAPSYALFSNAQKNLVDYITTPNVNSNIFTLIAQYWTEATYTDESNYNLGNRNIPQNFWNNLYVGALNNFQQAKLLIPNDVTDPAVVKNELEMTDIMEVYTYYYLVNTFGNIPYSQANNINKYPFPAYDDAKTVYYDMLNRLDTCINGLNPSAGSFGSADLLYGGNVNSWIKFANSLKLKMAMLIADSDPTTAQKKVNEAINGGVFQSNADNAVFKYTGITPNANPVWVNLVQSNRKDYVVTKTLLNPMVALNDPRRSAYYTNQYSGGDIGGTVGVTNTWNNYSNPYFSPITGTIIDPAAPSILLDYAEVSFLQAEAVERNFIAGNAETFYNNGVTASIEEWGGSATDAATYLAQPAVAYTTAPAGLGAGAIGSTGTSTTTTHWKQAIGLQQYIAYYMRGFDAWTSIRRLYYPAMAVPGSPKSPFPWRYTYPANEATANGPSYQAAKTAMGGDAVTIKLWWMQ
ncbi:SusD/RagB family nutrient-binding outer membrane lipoprotein [Hydrotalea sp.]|uniref:SusD/RagB family nutrient-binding outer membrane lipoprotein n=1 Tax=Hydrotalea sp. TaxID=2881279 RepID=UPI003D0F12F1